MRVHHFFKILRSKIIEWACKNIKGVSWRKKWNGSSNA
jgi:hypothetical protein